MRHVVDIVACSRPRGGRDHVVLTWVGSSPAKKTDASWKRLHPGLTSATK